jgi:Fe-S-cluster containining protein
VPPIQFELKIRDKVLGATVNLPSDAVRPAQLLPVFQRLGDAVIRASIPDQSKISCRAGCGACCRQLVPLAESEAFYLANVIRAMHPARRDAILSRFEELVDKLKSTGMFERLSREAMADKDAGIQAASDYLRLGLACPFLENESCGIYEHRPMVCREYLVTSPPEDCSPPPGRPIKLLPMPTMVSQPLYRFGDGKGEDRVKTVLLPLLLEFVASNQVEDQPLVPAAELFENFVRRLGGQTVSKNE